MSAIFEQLVTYPTQGRGRVRGFRILHIPKIPWVHILEGQAHLDFRSHSINIPKDMLPKIITILQDIEKMPTVPIPGVK